MSNRVMSPKSTLLSNRDSWTNSTNLWNLGFFDRIGIFAKSEFFVEIDIFVKSGFFRRTSRFCVIEFFAELETMVELRYFPKRHFCQIDLLSQNRNFCKIGFFFRSGIFVKSTFLSNCPTIRFMSFWCEIIRYKTTKTSTSTICQIRLCDKLRILTIRQN